MAIRGQRRLLHFGGRPRSERCAAHASGKCKVFVCQARRAERAKIGQPTATRGGEQRGDCSCDDGIGIRDKPGIRASAIESDVCALIAPSRFRFEVSNSMSRAAEDAVCLARNRKVAP